MEDNKEIFEYIQKSFDLKNQGFYKPAIEMLYKALSLENNNVEILSQLAELYYLLGNFDRAINYVEKTLEIVPLHVDCLKLKLKIYMSNGNFVEAQHVALTIFDLNSTQENFAKRIEILNKLKDLETVKSLEETDIEFNQEICYHFAVAYYQQQNYQKAIEYLEKAVNSENKSQKCEILLAQAYYNAGMPEQAKNIFNNYKDETKNAEIMNYLGLFSLDENNYEEAIGYLSRANKLEPQNAQYAYNLANAYFANGWREESSKYLNIAICLEPENVEYRYTQAYTYYLNSEYEKSLSELKNIFKINSKHVLSKVLEALNHYKLGDPVSAKVELSSVIKDNPENIFALKSLATVCAELSQKDLALNYMKSVIEKEPTLLNQTEFANLLIDTKSYDEAQEIIEKILAENSNYVDGHVLQSKLSMEIGDWQNAFDAAQEVIELDKNNSQGYYYNALALFELGDINFAIESMKKAISLDVNNAEYYVSMGEFYQKIGKNEDALAYISEAATIDNSAKNKELYVKLAGIVRKSRNK